MKKFILFFLKIILIVFSLSVVLDWAFTTLYTQKIDTSKFQFIKNQANKKFDYIFIGSSRVVNTIDTEVVDSVLNCNSINFGVMDAQPQDIIALLKIIKDYNIIYDTVFIQTDYYFNSIDKSKFLYTDMLPYIHDKKSIREYYSNEDDYGLLYYMPFYRYCKSDAKLGIRELLASLFRHNKNEIHKGFLPLSGFGHKWQRALPENINEDNIYNKEMISLLGSLGRKYVFFVAPFRSDTQNMNFISKLELQFPVLWDFSQSVPEDNKFRNGYHLNSIGAKEFSIQLTDSIRVNYKNQ